MKYQACNINIFYLTVVDCGALSNPANGSVLYTGGTTYGQTATYSCNTGYNLVGDGIRACQSTGVWSGSAPTCQGMLLLVSHIIHIHNGGKQSVCACLLPSWNVLSVSLPYHTYVAVSKQQGMNYFEF